MKRQISDEQLDLVLQTLIEDASADETLVGEIADSPALWWAVQRNINEQKLASDNPWPPVNLFRRWLLFAAPALAAVVIMICIFIFRPVGDTAEKAGGQQNVTSVAVSEPSDRVSEPAPPAAQFVDTAALPSVKPSVKIKTVTASVRSTKETQFRRKLPSDQMVAKNDSEIRSEFIALTYAGSPDSGQLIRVKVPSSMMVSLGLVSSVDKPSNLVDAEVVVGDDGLTRAIRFIR